MFERRASKWGELGESWIICLNLNLRRNDGTERRRSEPSPWSMMFRSERKVESSLQAWRTLDCEGADKCKGMYLTSMAYIRMTHKVWVKIERGVDKRRKKVLGAIMVWLKYESSIWREKEKERQTKIGKDVRADRQTGQRRLKRVKVSNLGICIQFVVTDGNYECCRMWNKLGI